MVTDSERPALGVPLVSARIVPHRLCSVSLVEMQPAPKFVSVPESFILTSAVKAGSRADDGFEALLWSRRGMPVVGGESPA